MQRRTFLAASAAMTAATALPRAALAAASTPLTQPWTGPYGGVPAFDKVKVADFVPALTQAMAEERAEVDKIAAQKSKPDFENTIGALERSGQTLSRALRVFYNLVGTDTNDTRRKLQADWERIGTERELVMRKAAVLGTAAAAVRPLH